MIYRSIEEVNLEDLIRHFNDAKRNREPDAIKVVEGDLYDHLLVIKEINPNLFENHYQLFNELSRNLIN
jgi:hypothetical protein